MNRREAIWCPAPDEDEDAEQHSITFRIADDWLAVDGRELILPVVLLARDGNDLQDQFPAVLKQFGGQSLLNDMLLSDYEVEEGSEWVLVRTADRTTIDGVPGGD